MPKLKLGALVYALVAAGTIVQVVLMLLRHGVWADVHGWVYVGLVAVVALSAALLVVGMVSRRGLIASDGPWICQNGWLVLIGLAAAGFGLTLLTDAAVDWLPTAPAVFVPHWVRRLQENYHAGRAEGERELSSRDSDEGSRTAG
jgi:hypothetical protein